MVRRSYTIPHYIISNAIPGSGISEYGSGVEPLDIGLIMSFEWFSVTRRHLFILVLTITTRSRYQRSLHCNVAACSGKA